jgi:hypothetical protein
MKIKQVRLSDCSFWADHDSGMWEISYMGIKVHVLDKKDWTDEALKIINSQIERICTNHVVE